MALEFKPQVTPPAPAAPAAAGAPARKNKRRRGFWVWTTLISVVVLGGTATYLAYVNREQAEIINDLTLNKDELEAEIRQLDQRVQTLDSELTRANQNLEAKQAEMENLLEKIAFLQQQVATYIRQGRVVEAERDRYQGLSQQLAYYNTKYQREIEVLKQENARLRAQVDSLQSQTGSLALRADSLQGVANTAQTELQGSRVLAIVDCRFIGVNRSRETEGPTLKARDVKDLLRVCITLAPNTLAPKGPRPVYAILFGPNNSNQPVINPANTGSFEHQGQLLQFSARGQVDYQGRATSLCMEYRLPEGERLAEGRYVARIYTDGFLLGQHALTIE
jgi:uncharacterized protein YlxW (UPF0749 family)